MAGQRRAPWPVLLMTREIGSGGSERQMTATARSLDPDLFQAHVGCFHKDGFRAAELSGAGIPVVEFPVRSFAKPSALQGAWGLARFLREKQIRLVHTFDVPTNIFAPFVVKQPLIQALNPCVMLGSCRAHRDLISPQLRRVLRWTDRWVDGIVVNCDFLKGCLVREEGVSAGRIEHCPNGIDIEEFHARQRSRPAEFGDAELVIGVVCVLRPEKDLPTLVNAFAKVRRPGIKLAIVGSGPCRDALVEQAGKLAVLDDCIFVPARARVAPYLRGIDIFVLPSLSEASSNSLMEAMASGCCPVASRVGGNPELVTEGTGLLFEAGNPNSLASQLTDLIDNPERRRGFAELAAQRAAERFSMETSVRCMQQLYLNYLGRRFPD